MTLTTTVTPGWESIQQAVGGREWIVRDGVTSISPHPKSADEIHPRSAIGLTADGRLILVTVDGREVGVSAGVRLPELAALMLARGAISAINLDGGGSSALVIRRAGTDGPVLANRPSDGYERPVTNSIQVISTMPTGPLSAQRPARVAQRLSKQRDRFQDQRDGRRLQPGSPRLGPGELVVDGADRNGRPERPLRRR